MRALLRNRYGFIIFVVAVWVAIYVLSDLTGFRAFYEASSTAKTVGRVFGVLIFGAFGLIGLFAPPQDGDRMRPLFYRLLGVAFLAISAIQITILAGDPLGVEGMAR